jgi:hypothetical protein
MAACGCGQCHAATVSRKATGWGVPSAGHGDEAHDEQPRMGSYQDSFSAHDWEVEWAQAGAAAHRTRATTHARGHSSLDDRFAHLGTAQARGLVARRDECERAIARVFESCCLVPSGHAHDPAHSQPPQAGGAGMKAPAAVGEAPRLNQDPLVKFALPARLTAPLFVLDAFTQSTIVVQWSPHSASLLALCDSDGLACVLHVQSRPRSAAQRTSGDSADGGSAYPPEARAGGGAPRHSRAMHVHATYLAADEQARRRAVVRGWGMLVPGWVWLEEAELSDSRRVDNSGTTPAAAASDIRVVNASTGRGEDGKKRGVGDRILPSGRAHSKREHLSPCKRTHCFWCGRPLWRRGRVAGDRARRAHTSPRQGLGAGQLWQGRT